MNKGKTKPLPPPQRGQRLISFLTQEELRRLLAAIMEKRDRTIFLVAYTAMAQGLGARSVLTRFTSASTCSSTLAKAPSSDTEASLATAAPC